MGIAAAVGVLVAGGVCVCIGDDVGVAVGVEVEVGILVGGRVYVGLGPRV